MAPKDQMVKSPDPHSSVSKHSASIKETTSQEDKVYGHCARKSSYAPQPVCQLLVWEPKAKGKHGMGAIQTYQDIILKGCGIKRENQQDLWKAMNDKNCWRYFSQI